MPEILVTNTETIHRESDALVKLYGRDENNEPHVVEVRGFRPYFYARADEVRGREAELNQQQVIHELEDNGYTAYTGEPVVRVYTRLPNEIRDAKELFDHTYDADIPFTNRFRIDTGIKAWVRYDESPCHYSELEPVEDREGQEPILRVVTLDIEVDDRFGFPKDGEQSVLSIVAHDCYEDEYVGFIDLDGQPIEEVFGVENPESISDLGVEEVDKLHFEPDEKRMLISFACWLKEHDPDLITAWNSDFDLPYLIRRMQRLGVNPARMSRESKAFVTRRGKPVVKGRTVYDMLGAYKANSWNELDSYKLDEIAADVLGERKIKHGGSVYDLWADDPATLLNYNGRDVRLTVEIDEQEAVIGFRDQLRQQVGVDFEDTLNASDFAEMNARRKLYEKGVVGPTAEYQRKNKKYEGAVVFEPFSGVAANVVGMDLASLYPYTMWMLNSSPETKVAGQKVIDSEHGLCVLGDGDQLIPVAEAPNGVCFRLDRDGLFRELVDDALALKTRFKELKNEAESKEEREYWEVRYNVSKTITNSYYGVIGWSRFFLYDEETAEAITTMGQSVIKATQHYVTERTDGEVIYGDTDSNYVRFPHEWEKDRCIEHAELIAEKLNTEVYPKLAVEHGMKGDCKWEIEVEVYIERFFQAGKKKRYAYLATWKDGRDIEPDYEIKGFDSKRSDTAEVTEKLQTDVLHAILDGADTTDLGTLIYEAAQAIDPDDPAWERIGIPSGLGKHIHERCSCDDCYAWSTTGDHPKDAHPRGAYFSNKIAGTDFGKNSKPKRVYVEPFHHEAVSDEIDVLCYEEPEELPDGVRVDAGKMTQTIIVNPLRKILDAVSVDVDAAVRGQMQTGLGRFM